MKKSTIKEALKVHAQAAAENQVDVKALDVLNPAVPAPEADSLSQRQIQRNVNLYTREKAFDLKLESGPYNINHTENGAYLLITNTKGYASAYSTHSLKVIFETETQERIHDACWLHNELFFAAAQESSVFIYNSDGVEQHAVRGIALPRSLQFLPYHFLLASTTANSRLKYLDTSTGEIVSDLYIKDKNPTVMGSNPTNGVVHLGDARGTVTLWAPSQPECLMKIKTHTAAVTGIVIERSGNRMITTGLDRKIRSFDVRQSFKPLTAVTLKKSAKKIALSTRNMLAIAQGNKITVLKDLDKPYLAHSVPGEISSLEFCPFEDVLSIGHANGVSNIIVPGCGDPIYDSLEATPFMTKKQRQELEVKRLLEKIPFDLIAQESPLSKVAEKVEIRPQVSERYFKVTNREKKALDRFKKDSYDI